MYKLLFSILCMTLISVNTSAQLQDSTKMVQKHHIGMHASSLGGLGFSYRYWPSKLGVQVTALPIFRKNKSQLLSVGATALYALKKGKTVDLYAYTGLHYLRTTSGNQGGNVINALNTGVGVGFKINLSESFNLNLQTGYGLYNITGQLFTSIAGGGGLYYSF